MRRALPGKQESVPGTEEVNDALQAEESSRHLQVLEILQGLQTQLSEVQASQQSLCKDFTTVQESVQKVERKQHDIIAQLSGIQCQPQAVESGQEPLSTAKAEADGQEEGSTRARSSVP